MFSILKFWGDRDFNCEILEDISSSGETLNSSLPWDLKISSRICNIPQVPYSPLHELFKDVSFVKLRNLAPVNSSFNGPFWRYSATQ